MKKGLLLAATLLIVGCHSPYSTQEYKNAMKNLNKTSSEETSQEVDNQVDNYLSTYPDYLVKVNDMYITKDDVKYFIETAASSTLTRGISTNNVLLKNMPKINILNKEGDIDITKQDFNELFQASINQAVLAKSALVLAEKNNIKPSYDKGMVMYDSVLNLWKSQLHLVEKQFKNINGYEETKDNAVKPIKYQINKLKNNKEKYIKMYSEWAAFTEWEKEKVEPTISASDITAADYEKYGLSQGIKLAKETGTYNPEQYKNIVLGFIAADKAMKLAKEEEKSLDIKYLWNNK